MLNPSNMKETQDLKKWCITNAKEIVQIDKQGKVLEVAMELFEWIVKEEVK